MRASRFGFSKHQGHHDKHNTHAKKKHDDQGAMDFMALMLKREFSDAQQMLLKNPVLFLSEVTGITDYSGRKFKKLAPLPYLLWSNDKRGVKMLINSVPKDTNGYKILLELKKQYQSHIKKGVNFTLNGVEYKKQTHYSDRKHISQVKAYVESHDLWDEHEREHHWITKVGLAQKDVHVRIAMKVAYAGGAKNNLKFFQETDSKSPPVWFPLDNSELGQKYAILHVPNCAVACKAPSKSLADSFLAALELYEDQIDPDYQKIGAILDQAIFDATPQGVKDRDKSLLTNLEI